MIPTLILAAFSLAPKLSPVTCEYVRRDVNRNIVGYVFYAGKSVKAMTAQYVLSESDPTPKYVVGTGYQIDLTTVVATFATSGH